MAICPVLECTDIEQFSAVTVAISTAPCKSRAIFEARFLANCNEKSPANGNLLCDAMDKIDSHCRMSCDTQACSEKSLVFWRRGLFRKVQFLEILEGSRECIDSRHSRDSSSEGLSGTISRDIAIVSLRYPLSRDTLSAIAAIPQEGAIPPLGAFFYTDISVWYPILQHIARYLCDIPGKQARKHFAILSLKVSRDMKSIATGPLR